MIDQQIASRVAAYRDNPQQLQQRYAVSQELIDLLALQKIKSDKEAAAREMQLKLAQQQAANGETPTIAQQRENEVMDLTKQEIASQRGDLLQQQEKEKQQRMNQLMSGVANAPGAQNAMTTQAMAAGGIVAFNGQDQSYVPRSAVAPSPFGGPAAERGSGAPKVSLSNEDERDILARIEAKIKEGTATPSEVRRANGIRARLLGNRAEPRGAAAPAAAVSAPNIPSYNDDISGSDFKFQERRIQEPPPPGAQTKPPPQQRPPQAGIPAALPQGAAPAAPGGIPTAIPPRETEERIPLPTLPTNPVLEAAINKNASLDPEARQQAEEARIEAKRKLTPEQRAVYQAGIDERDRMMKEEFDPERQRLEGIKRFLIGMGGRAYGELGAGASASMGYEEAQRQAKKRAFEDLQKSREGLIGLDRKAVEESLAGGLETLKSVNDRQRTSTTAGASILGDRTKATADIYQSRVAERGQDINARTQQRGQDINYSSDELNRRSRERISAASNAVEAKRTEAMLEANQLAKQQADDSRTQNFITNTERWMTQEKRKIEEAIQKDPRINMLMIKDPKLLSKDEKKDLEAAKLEARLAQAKIDEAMGPVLNRARAKLGIGVELSKEDRSLIEKHLGK